MTKNVTDWLAFPQTALQKKEILLDQVFEGILEDENEKDFREGKRIDFFMNSFKDALDDYENRSDPALDAVGASMDGGSGMNDMGAYNSGDGQPIAGMEGQSSDPQMNSGV